MLVLANPLVRLPSLSIAEDIFNDLDIFVVSASMQD